MVGTLLKITLGSICLGIKIMPLVFIVKVAPSSGRQVFQIDKSGVLKCYLKGAPEKGQANQELLDFLAKSLKLPKQSVQLLSGASSRHKKIWLDLDISLEELLDILGVGEQKKLFG